MTEEQKKQLSDHIGKRVMISSPTHPWFEEVGKIKEFDTIGGRFACIVSLDNGIECCVFNGKELKYLS